MIIAFHVKISRSMYLQFDMEKVVYIDNDLYVAFIMKNTFLAMEFLVDRFLFFVLFLLL